MYEFDDSNSMWKGHLKVRYNCGKLSSNLEIEGYVTWVVVEGWGRGQIIVGICN